MSYVAGQVRDAAELRELIERLNEELRNIEKALNSELRLPTKSAAPERPRNGTIAYADGTVWDPGSGEGIYGYYNAQWNKLG